MAVHPPKDFERWSKTKQKAWTARWGQVNNIGKVVERAMVGTVVKATVPVPKNNTLDVHHAPEPKKVPAMSPCDESAPSGTEPGRRGEARAQKLRDAEQKKLDKTLADELARDGALQKARLQRAAANKAASEQAEDSALSESRTLSSEGLEVAKEKRLKRTKK